MATPSPNTPGNIPNPSWHDFAKWAGVFAIYAMVSISVADSDKYGDIIVSLTWLVATGATIYWWNDLAQSLKGMTGANIPLTSSLSNPPSPANQTR